MSNVEREKRAVKTMVDKTQGRILWDLIESRRSGRSDSVAQNRKGWVGWIEFKALEKWPVRATTTPLKGAFEKGQLAYLRERNSWGGRNFVILRVDLNEWLLLSPMIALETLTTAGLVNSAVEVGFDNIVRYLEAL